MSHHDHDPVPEDAQDFMKNNGRTFMITKRKDGSPTAHPWRAGTAASST